MKRHLGLIATIVLFGSTGCASGSHREASRPPQSGSGSAESGPPYYVSTDFDAFFAPYRRAFADVAGQAAPDRQLVQLGLADTNKVVLWYALGSNAIGSDPLRVSTDGAPVPPDRLTHSRNVRYGTGRVEIAGLNAGTSYRLSISGAGLQPHTLTARTAGRGEESFSFLFASCFAPYSTQGQIATIARGERASMGNFRDRASAVSTGAPSFFIGLGDQMYTDPGATEENPRIAYLFGDYSERIRGTADSVPDYLNYLYRLSFGIPAMDSAFASTPAVMMWDDHDIRDGWGSQGDEYTPGWRRYYQHARDAFVAFQAARNPNFDGIVNARHWERPHPEVSLPNDAAFAERQVEEMHFSFDRGELATFFVADGRSAKRIGPQLIGRQYEDIQAWLTNPGRSGRPTVFVFAYPVPVAANIGRIFVGTQKVPSSNRDDALDRIHPEDREKLLHLFATHFAAQPRHMLVIISGDVHYSGLQSIREGGPDGRTYGYEIISSGLAQTEYNTLGGRYGAVSGWPRSLDLDLPQTQMPWIQDHGIYQGPSFAELFVSRPKDNASPPQIALEFYPAVLDGVAYRLRGGPGADRWPHPIESYPENVLAERTLWSWLSSFGRRRNTINELPNLLSDFWVKSGRATPVP